MTRATPAQRQLCKLLLDGPAHETVLHASTLAGCLRRGLVVYGAHGMVHLTATGRDLVRPRLASQMQAPQTSGRSAGEPLTETE